MTDITEEEYRTVAWDIIGRLSIATVLQDCVDALVEAYQLDETLYYKDKEFIDEETQDDTTDTE